MMIVVGYPAVGCRAVLMLKPNKNGGESRESPNPALRHSVRGFGDIRLHEITGLLEGVLGVTDGNPLLFGAQIFSVGELESGERAGARRPPPPRGRCVCSGCGGGRPRR